MNIKKSDIERQSAWQLPSMNLVFLEAVNEGLATLLISLSTCEVLPLVTPSAAWGTPSIRSTVRQHMLHWQLLLLLLWKPLKFHEHLFSSNLPISYNLLFQWPSPSSCRELSPKSKIERQLLGIGFVSTRGKTWFAQRELYCALIG